jgi:hypothetical protein
MTFEASISGKNIRDLGGAAIRRWAIAGFRGAWAATNDSPRFFVPAKTETTHRCGCRGLDRHSPGGSDADLLKWNGPDIWDAATIGVT